MDFKVAGTAEGITALQMDVKCPGLSKEIMGKALSQAREARLAVLAVMRQTLEAPRTELSQYAPRIVTIQINPDRIRDVVGPLGKNIRSIIEKTGCKIDIEDTGEIKIASSSAEAIEQAIALVKGAAQDAEIGEVYTGKVKKIMDFGAFVEILPGVEGLVHISQLARERVAKVTDVLKVGDEVQVKVLEIDSNGKIRLSRKVLLGGGDGQEHGEERGHDRARGHDRGKRRRD
jgi:polyribonucleotide nucleotidyltransferase